jgi:type VI secretion system protein ImpA
MSDYTQYVAPLGGDLPSGPNLEYDPRFQQFERTLQGKAEQRIGDKVNSAEPPDWGEVRQQAETLLGVTRDLRIAVPLCLATLHIDGFTGFSQGLALVQGLLEQQWDSIHPQLDAEDNNDPTTRVNSLLALAAAEPMLKALREAPVVRSKALGRRFSLRDFRVAAGKIKPGALEKDPAQSAQIDGAFQEDELESLRASAQSVAAALDHVAALDRILVEKVADRAPDLMPLRADLAELNKILQDRVGARSGISVGAAGGAGAGDGDASGNPSGGIDGLRTRDDVVRLLDRVCDYYRRHEPSSPVPLLLERAKRLVAMDFLQIVRDLTPAGVSEAELIAGVEKK